MNAASAVNTGDEVVRDISQIMRPHLHPAAGSARDRVLAEKKKTGARNDRDVSPEPTRPVVKGTIFERLTDSKLYTGHHKHRFDQVMNVLFKMMNFVFKKMDLWSRIRARV